MGILINQKEVCRYLGYKNAKPDSSTQSLIDSCVEEVLQVSEPKNTYRRFKLEFPAEDEIKIESLDFKSKNLGRNLKGCKEVILFAATLGRETDRVLAKYVKTNIAKGVVFQAVAAAAIEAYCDSVQEKIEAEMAKENLFVRPRFSPGYGDVNLNIQKDFLNLINASKTVGIILSDGGIMIPEKSVSAFMGLSTLKTDCIKQGCEACGKPDCEFKR